MGTATLLPLGLRLQTGTAAKKNSALAGEFRTMALYLCARLHWQAKALHAIPLPRMSDQKTTYHSACPTPARLLQHASEINLPPFVFVTPAQPHSGGPRFKCLLYLPAVFGMVVRPHAGITQETLPQHLWKRQRQTSGGAIDIVRSGLWGAHGKSTARTGWMRMRAWAACLFCSGALRTSST